MWLVFFEGRWRLCRGDVRRQAIPDSRCSHSEDSIADCFQSGAPDDQYVTRRKLKMLIYKAYHGQKPAHTVYTSTLRTWMSSVCVFTGWQRCFSSEFYISYLTIKKQDNYIMFVVQTEAAGWYCLLASTCTAMNTVPWLLTALKHSTEPSVTGDNFYSLS